MYVGAVAVGLMLMSHEFWMQPAKFVVAPGDTSVVNFRVGENFIGEPWKVSMERFHRLELHNATTINDLLPTVVEGVDGFMRVPLIKEGTHMIVMQSVHASMEMEAETFNAYLKEDGLDDAYAYRRRTNTLDQKAKESYARYSKVLMQAGKKTDDTYKKAVGLPLEIIPLTNPYALKFGERLQFKILFQGKPLFGAKVKVWNQYNHQTAVQTIYCQQDGTVDTYFSGPGTWMVSVVHITPLKDREGEWESFWGTLTFGTR